MASTRGAAARHNAAPNVVPLRSRKELTRKEELLSQLGVKKPFEITDANSRLTIDAGVGATQVDTFANVPKGAQHDGLFVTLTQTEAATARVEGDGIEAQKSIPLRTMAGAFNYWAGRNGAMMLAGIEYSYSELDRVTGEVVLSDRSTDEEGRPVLNQRRLRPSAGVVVGGEATLTAMPPKVGLVGLGDEYQPEPAYLAASGSLQAGTLLHVSGKSIEALKAEVTSMVRSEAKDGWSDPTGTNVVVDTWLRVTNVDRAPIHHDEAVLRSGEAKKSYYGEAEGPAAYHTTELPNAKLHVAPGETQEIHVQRQTGRAHVEFRLTDPLVPRRTGEGDSSYSVSANRFMVLERTQIARHAGTLKFYDGINELGSAIMKGATLASTATTSGPRSSSVIVGVDTTWSPIRAGGDDTHKAQTVTKEYALSNISAVAGQAKLTIEIGNFTSIDSVKINGFDLKRTLTKPEFSARLESEPHGGAKVLLTLNMAQGSEATPAERKLKVEVQGKYKLEV